MSFSLTSAGRNLSAGQKTRVLIARALHLAIAQKRKLIFAINISSLDVQNRRRLKLLLNDLSNKIAIGFVNQELDQLDVQVDQQKKINTTSAVKPLPDKQEVHGVFPSIYWSIAFCTLSMCLPAGILSYTGFLIQEKLSLYGLWVITGLSSCGIISGILLGYWTENKIRKMSRSLMVDGLMSFSDDSKHSDKYQILSHDFATVNERIAWYVHDISWICSLAIIAIGTLVVNAGWVSFVILSVWSVSYYALWKILVPKVISARLRSIDGNNMLLDLAEDRGALGQIENHFTREFCRKMVSDYFSYFWTRRKEMIWSKSALAIYAHLVTKLGIVAVSFTFVALGTGSGLASMVLLAIFSVDAEIMRLFLAFSGLQSQSISLDRLNNFGRKKSGPVLAKQISSTEIETPEFVSLLTKRRYPTVKFQVGRLHSLVGRSGLGKTQFFRGIVGSIPTESSDVYSYSPVSFQVWYFDSRCKEAFFWEVEKRAECIFEIVQNVVSSPENISADERLLILLDEVFIDISVVDAQNELIRIQSICNSDRVAIVVVDHRFQTDLKIDLEKILESGNG